VRGLPTAGGEPNCLPLGPLAFPRYEEPLEVLFLLWAGSVGDFQEALPALRLGFETINQDGVGFARLLSRLNAGR
jgi:hypothetical protein